MRTYLPWALPFAVFFVFPLATFPAADGKWLAVYLLGLAAAALLSMGPLTFPRCSRPKAAGLALLLALMVAHLFWKRPADWLFPLLDRLSFLLLTWLAWREFRRTHLTRDQFWWPLAISLLGGGLTGYASFLRNGAEALSLGMPSFLGLGLLWFWSLELGEGPLRRWVFALSSAAALLSLGATEHVGVLVAVAAGEAIIHGKRLKKDPWFALVMAVVLGVGTALAPHPPRGKMIPKELWKASVQLIRADPLGAGLGSFGFRSLPFQENPSDEMLLASPSNDFLRFPAEEGLPLAAGYAAVFLMLVSCAWASAPSPEKRWVAGIAAYLLIESFSRAYFDPAFLVACAFYFGYLASLACPEVLERGGHVYRTVAALASAGMLLLVARAAVSRTLEGSTDLDRSAMACEVAAGNWRACLNFAKLSGEQGKMKVARSVTQQVLLFEPTNFAGLRQMAWLAEKGRDTVETCFYLWQYDDLFRNHSSLHEAFQKTCPITVQNYLLTKRPGHYFGRQGSLNPVIKRPSE